MTSVATFVSATLGWAVYATEASVKNIIIKDH